jgi:hypothetical protein
VRRAGSVAVGEPKTVDDGCAGEIVPGRIKKTLNAAARLPTN